MTTDGGEQRMSGIGIDKDLLRDGVAYADLWVSYQQDRRAIPGVVVAVRHGDELLLSQGYGHADLEGGVPMTPRHIFRVASHSKTFTATAIMQLLERGALRLDDRLAAYIPWLERQEGLARVTIRQALNHAGGIVRDGNEADYWQLDGDFPDQEGLRRLAEDGGAVLATDETFKYSNIGYALLGQVVEVAAGLPYNEYVGRHVVAPLGLRDTGPETDDRARERLATGYTRPRLGLPRRPIPDTLTGAMSPATGFYATAEDLCRYASAHFFGNEELLSDAAKREMQQPYWKIDGSDERYGLGFSVVEIGDRRLLGHGGGFPGHATRTMFDPKDRLVVVVLNNETGGPAGLLATAIVKIIDFALRQPRRPRRPEGRPAPYERFTGRFVNLWGATDVAAFGDTLAVLNPDDDDPVKEVTRVVVEDDETLRIKETNGYGSPGEAMRYARDAAGRVTKVAGGVTLYPPDIFREREERAMSALRDTAAPGAAPTL